MKKIILFIVLVSFLTGCTGPRTWLTNAQAKIEPRSINEIGEDYFEFTLRTNPLYATHIGDHRYDHLLPDISKAARMENRARLNDFLSELKAIDMLTLNEQDLLRYELLSNEIATLARVQECEFPLWLVDQLDGPHITIMELATNHSLKEPKDVANLIERYRKSKGFFLEHISNLREGRRLGLTAARINIAHVVEQLEAVLAQDPQLSPLMIHPDFMPKGFTKKQKTDAATTILFTIKSVVYPALQYYRDYLKYELQPDARSKIALNALPMGKACYQNLIERHTGIRKSPQEIHAEGLYEVARIHAEMRKLIQAHTEMTDEKAYFAALKQNPAQYLASADALIAHNKELVQRALKELPRAFGHLPHTGIEVVPIEHYRQKHAPVAHYQEAPADGSRTAFYYLNTYQPERRPLYSMAALAFHEAAPGHHLQFSLSNENNNIPRYQRHLGQTAYVEGWALYAEILARELGLYHTVEETFGSLNYELWRALRLVVDTGIHFYGWSRDRALSYLSTNSALTSAEIANEIDRYLVWPAQALAYKIGQMEFQQLRSLAESALKDRFSLTEFHDQILKNGALPMATLRRSTLRWLKSTGDI